ncbi:MAG: NADH-quinone oxidoreductase subunit NuoE [Alphaproteobacteria bacterium]|jgi:NADH-quinone oxidoreductase E subunit|nr:NADH-quinone oxidoreductase subunit NuoE [Alphaproteobacteria bacterium]MBT5860276.1 NADH-quinone oxidoreductase subunit NuoE [Alphaproteobacteria bacterium]
MTDAPFKFNADNKALTKTVIAKYPKGRQASAVLPLLDLAQRQNDGWLSRAAMDHVAEVLDMAPVRVYEVATFYSMFNLKPVGKHHVQVCTTTPCWLRGSDGVLDACKKKLGVEPGETTADGKFTLSEAECLAACVNAPMVQIGDDYFEDLDAESVTKVLDDLAAGKTPTPGPQVKRQTSAPVSGAKTLVKGA